MSTYYVEYILFPTDTVRGIQVIANSKVEAYDNAVYGEIPAETGELPYSAWVHSVTYNNGNYRVFNTHSGKPY